MDEPETDLFLEACLLLLLREAPGTRPELTLRIRAFSRADGRDIGSALRSLERIALVRSAWQPFSAHSTPARCYYITTRGMNRLGRYATTLRAAHLVMHELRDESGESGDGGESGE